MIKINKTKALCVLTRVRKLFKQAQAAFLICVMIFGAMFVTNVYGLEPEEAHAQVVFTYEQARQAILESIPAVRDIDETIREIQGQRHDLLYAIRQLRDVSPFPEDSGRANRAAQRDLNEFDRNMQGLRRQQEQARLAAEFNLRRTAASMAELGIQTETLMAELALAENNLRRAAIRYEFGLVSSRDLSAARYQVAGYRARLEELTRSRQNILLELNILLGQPLDQDTLIELEIVTPGLPVNLTQHIQDLVQQAPSIIRLQAEVDRAMDERWVYAGGSRNQNIVISARDRQRAWAEERPTHYTGPQRPHTAEVLEIRNRLALQEAVERAVAERDQARLALEAAIRRGFNDYSGMLDLAEALDAQLTRAQAALDIVLMEYELGLVARHDVEQARMALTRARHNTQALNIQIWLMSFRLQNPSLL